jgi:hypothetical protein
LTIGLKFEFGQFCHSSIHFIRGQPTTGHNNKEGNDCHATGQCKKGGGNTLPAKMANPTAMPEAAIPLMTTNNVPASTPTVPILRPLTSC